MNSNFIIAIDGPTASGKGTVAKILSTRFGIPCLSTGAIYRGIAIYFMDNKIRHDDIDKITEKIDKVKLDVKCEGGDTLIFVDGKDVTARLDDIITSENVAGYAKIPVVRARVKQIQNMVVQEKSIVCEGRDITSVVFPDAKYKFYLTARLSVRAKRRFRQETANSATTRPNGEPLTLKNVRKGIAGRDHTDMTREHSPLVHVKDAILINSSRLNSQQTVDKIERIIRKQEKPFTPYRKKSFPEDFRPPRAAGFWRRVLKTSLIIPFRIVYPMRLINKKELKKHYGKPVIFAFNHRSNIDGFVIFYVLPRFYLFFIGKESLFKPRSFQNWFLRVVNVFPTRPGNDLAMLRHCFGILKSGKSLVIFPEGRRNFSPEDALALRNGTAVIAMKSGVPVVPIVTNRKASPFRYTKFKIGTTIYPSQFTDKNEFSQKLGDSMRMLLENFEHKPRQKKWDRIPVPIARGIVFIENKLVVIKRIKNGETYFVFPGGHIDEGENARDAAIREVLEETNITSTAVRPLYKSMYARKDFKGRGTGMNLFYLCSYQSGEVGKTDAEEYSDEKYRKELGVYEPMLVDIDELSNIDLRPNVVRDQLVKDIKKYSIHLARPMKFVK